MNAQLAAATGQDVLMVAALAVTPGEAVRLTFEQVNSPWRQGVWIGTEGLLAVTGQSSNQFVLWSDTAPRDLEIVVERTDGALRLYNVWDSGRGSGRFESQRSTSGMIQTKRDDGSLEFRCNDIGTSPDFSKLVFSILVGRSLGDWTFVVEEVSNLVFRARGTDTHGRSVERTGSGPADEVLAEAKAAARQMIAKESESAGR